MNVSSISSAASGVYAANLSMAASLKVLDMAQSVFEDAASELIEAMSAAITGIGQNIDVYA